MKKHIFEFDKALIIEITKRCPYACSYCLNGSNFNKIDAQNLDMDIMSHIPLIKKFTEAGWCIEFTGGEPFIHPHSIKSMNELSGYGQVFVMSNGYNLKSIENKIDERVSILATWHPASVKFEDFYWESKKEKTQYFYLIHPKNIENGIVERHLNLFNTLDKKPYIGYFKGIWNGQKYNYRSEIYKQFPSVFTKHLEKPRQVLFVDVHGYAHNHYTPEPICRFSEMTIDRAEKEIEWIKHNDY